MQPPDAPLSAPTPAPLPLYLVGSGPSAERARTAGAVLPDAVFRNAAAFLPLSERAAGVVLLAPDGLPPEDVVALLRACAEARAGWTPALLIEEQEGPVVLPLAAGSRYELGEVSRFCGTGEGGLLLSLAQVFEHVRTVRHDINNPLAAGLAETQLLLMDVADDPTRRALQTIEAQLRRIRDLVASLSVLRPRRPGERPN